MNTGGRGALFGPTGRCWTALPFGQGCFKIGLGREYSVGIEIPGGRKGWFIFGIGRNGVGI